MSVLSDSSTLHRLGRALLELVYPGYCLHCGARSPKRTFPLCACCLASLRRVPRGEPLRRLHRLPEAMGCFQDAHSLWYASPSGPFRPLHHALKYANRPVYALHLGRLLGQTFQNALSSIELIIPVPLHRRRYLERGYNQSAWLARGIGEVLGRPVKPELLMRVRPTQSQTYLDREARRANVAHAFVAPYPERVAGRHVLLVDDLLTTGATAAWAAQALHQVRVGSLTLVTLGLAV
ncbi:ComF family protein [Rhodothermus profundi]|uniref:ComF family protein n=1 Tax=Rhodothermus profundi TaxID=633813 RepID=A0A1M6SUK2_9BACT|nr:ComF family protein [Rhodothermus profundi]SHK48404.1 comF family protein [Rhodothermus profundi]